GDRAGAVPAAVHGVAARRPPADRLLAGRAAAAAGARWLPGHVRGPGPAGEEFRPGSVHLVTADGAVRQVADDIAFPNGMAVTADNSTLIVADSYRHQLVGFDIGADGGLSGRRVWADLGDGTPDGICTDAQDAVWYADVPNRRCVRVADGGTVLQTVDLDRSGFACALGGPAGTTLFI